MRICGIVCEYNPFHNGHLYQINKIKKELGFDAIVGVMSGNWTQRGDVAIFDKSTRAKAAVLNGMDLVLELPAIHSIQSAEIFSRNAITILHSLGIVDSIAFGTEYDDIKLLEDISEILVAETNEFKSILKKELNNGNPYFLAREKAIYQIIGNDAKDAIREPNNILAIEYIKSIKRLNSSMKPIAIKRYRAQHHDKAPNDNIASASSIREYIEIMNNNNSINLNKNIQKVIPENCLGLYSDSDTHNLSSLDTAILCHLIKCDLEELENTVDVVEGLENRIKKCVTSASTVAELCDMVKSKRYTHSRIRRIILNSFLKITKADSKTSPLYIKILDFTDIGRKIIKQAKKTTILPIAKNRNGIKGLCNAEKIWDRELNFDRIYEFSKIENNTFKY